MIISLQISNDSRRAVAGHADAVRAVDRIIAESIFTAATAGTEDVRRQLMTGQLGLTMRNPASGMAASVMTWWLNEQEGVAAVGVPDDTPAAGYSRIQSEGGTIRPKAGRALAIPISHQAKQYSSPRQMANLVLIKRHGRPPLLVEEVINKRSGNMTRMIPHWVLVPSVFIKATHWLERGMLAAVQLMTDAAQSRADELLSQTGGAQ